VTELFFDKPEGTTHRPVSSFTEKMNMSGVFSPAYIHFFEFSSPRLEAWDEG
jgi:hypothetical protein